MLATVFNDSEVATIHKRCVNLCQQIMDILVNDITYLSEELRYWRNIASLSHGSRYLTTNVHRGPHQFFFKMFRVGKSCVMQKFPSMWLLTFNQKFKTELLEIDNELFRKIMTIRAIIEDRVKQLARVNKVIARLRYVYLVVDGVDRGPASVLAALAVNSPLPSNNHRFPTAGNMSDMSPEEEALQAFSRREVRRALDELSQTLQHLLTVDGVLHRLPREGRGSTEDSDLLDAENRYYRSMSMATSDSGLRLPLGELIDHTDGLFQKLQLKLVDGRCRNIIDESTRRPSNFRQHWLKYLLVGIGTMCVARGLRKYINSGQFQRAFWYSIDLVLGKIREHIVEPIQDLTTNLFDTLQRRDPIVTHDELVQSHMALSRMLESYEGKSNSGMDLSGIVDKVTSTVAFPPGHKNSSSEKPAAVSPAQPKLSGSSSPKNRLSTSTQVSAMDRLMRDYEKELQTPIKGLLFGDLIRSVLIQMQELKVHTESAMLTMDQVLASNELTIAVSAAIPGFCLIGGGVYLMKNFIMRRLFKPTQRLQGGIPRLRIALAEIIRSLHDVEDGELDPLAPSNVEEGWYGRGAPPIAVCQSEQDLGSPAAVNIGLSLSSVPSIGAGLNAPAPPATTRHRSLSGSRAPPGSIENTKVQPSLSGVFAPDMGRALSISQEDIIKHVPSSPRLARFAIKTSPEKPIEHRKSIPKATRRTSGSNLKVDANVLIKWGKGKDEEYRRGLLIYRVISLQRLIVAFIGASRSSVIHRRMDVGIYDRDGPLGPKDAVRIMDLLGVVEEEYNCLIRDLQDLMLPDFEISLRRKIETASRMQQTYKCFSTM